jgi:DNA-directed RNA polymerase subunit E"
MKKKACKKCKIFVTGTECPICGGSNFSTSFYGRMYFFDTSKSMVAERINVKKEGEYAIKIR